MKLKFYISNLLDKIECNVRRFLEKLIGTIEYTIFVWKEDIWAEWDYWFIYKFVKFKLMRMADYYERGLYIGSDKDYLDILDTISLIGKYEAYESYQFLPDLPTREDFIRNEEQSDEAWNKFHNMLRDNARRWWF